MSLLLLQTANSAQSFCLHPQFLKKKRIMFLSLKPRCFSLVYLHTSSPQCCSAVFPCLYENHVTQSYIIASIQEPVILTLFNLMNEANLLFPGIFFCLSVPASSFLTTILLLCLFQREFKIPNIT